MGLYICGARVNTLCIENVGWYWMSAVVELLIIIHDVPEDLGILCLL